MIVNCSYCKKECNKKPFQIQRSKNLFCSIDCSNKFKKDNSVTGIDNQFSTQKLVDCSHCGKEFAVRNYIYQQFINGDRQNIFCGRKCLSDWQREEFKGSGSVLYDSIELTCDFCGCKYTKRKSASKSSKFCSRECKDGFKAIKVKVQCNNCGNEIERIRSKIGEYNFCNNKCSGQFKEKKLN